MRIRRPKMVTGTTEMVQVAWILKNLKYSVDGFADYDGKWTADFASMVECKARDVCFERLLNTIEQRGWRVPIVLVKSHTGFYGGEKYGLTLGNGHHRMTAAILLCVDEIPVFWGTGSEYMYSHASDTEPLLPESDAYAGIKNLIFGDD